MGWQHQECRVRTFFPSCINSPGGKEYLQGLPDVDSTWKAAVGKRSNDKSTIPAFNFNIHNTVEEKVKVQTLLNNHQKEPVIEAFVQPLFAHTADMGKIENLVIKTNPKF